MKTLPLSDSLLANVVNLVPEQSFQGDTESGLVNGIGFYGLLILLSLGCVVVPVGLVVGIVGLAQKKPILTKIGFGMAIGIVALILVVGALGALLG